MKIVKGDLIKAAKEGKFDVIVHGCNCFCTMGAGIAQQIKMHFPEAYKVDMRTNNGQKRKLGGISWTEHTEPTVVNAYTQFHYGFKQVNADYKAIRSCMDLVKYYFGGFRIGMPKIGCGLAGGDWNIVSKIIEEELKGEDVTIMVLEGGFPHA